MKNFKYLILAILLLLPASVWATDAKISALTNKAIPVGADSVPLVNSADATKTYKTTLTELLSVFAPAGTPTNPTAAEMGYISGLSSAVQTQLTNLSNASTSGTDPGHKHTLGAIATSAPLSLANGAYMGETINGTSAAALTQWAEVYMNSSGTWDLAAASAVATKSRGVVTAAVVNPGDPCVVLTFGYYRNDSGSALTVGADYFLSATPGVKSSSAPASGNQLQVCGYALASKIRRVCPSMNCYTIQ